MIGLYSSGIKVIKNSLLKLMLMISYLEQLWIPMSMICELNYFLGLQVKQTSEGIFISQSKYPKDLVKRFGLDGKSHARTPMSTNVKIRADLTRKQVDHTLYKSMIESLLYLTAS